MQRDDSTQDGSYNRQDELKAGRQAVIEKIGRILNNPPYEDSTSDGIVEMRQAIKNNQSENPLDLLNKLIAIAKDKDSGLNAEFI